MYEFLQVLLLNLVPGIELRGGIPLGVYLGLDPLAVFGLSVLANMLIIPCGFVGLDILWKRFFSRIAFFRGVLEKAHVKSKPYLNKYGLLGLGIFVAIPLPATGAYTGTLLAWALGMDRRASGISIAGGVLVAGILVLAVSLGALEALRWML